MKKIKSSVAPADRKAVKSLPSDGIQALFAITEDCKSLSRALPVLRASVENLERAEGQQAPEVAKVGRTAVEYTEMLFLSLLHQLDGYDDREFFNDAQKPQLTAPRLYVSLEDVARERLEFYRRVDELRRAFVERGEADAAGRKDGAA